VPSFFMALALLISVTVLSACTDEKQARDGYEKITMEADQALTKAEPRRMVRPALIVDEKPWYGHQAVRMRNGDPLPVDFTQPNSVVMTFERGLTLNEFARQIQISTGLRVVVTAEDRKEGSGETVQAQTFLPFDGVEVTGGRVLWQGSLDSLLNQVSDQYDVEWSFVNNVVRLTSQVTRTFMMHALAGEVTTTGSVETGSSGEAGNLPSQNVDTTVTLALWDEIEEAVENILSSRGNATFSPATGTITVSGAPSSVREVEDYLRYQNRMRLRRVAVTVRVLSVQQTETNNVDFNLEAVVKRGLDNQPFFFDAGTAGVSTGVVRAFPADLTRVEIDGDTTITDATDDGLNDSVSAVIDALARENRVGIVHTGTVVTLSDQPAPLQVARQRTYVARVSAAATTDSSSTSLEPGTVEEGLTMNVLPRVIEQDRVLLRLGVGITQVREIADFVAGDLTVQLPDLDTTGFLQNIVLSGGETLVMSGFERNDSTVERAGVGDPNNIFLGGTRGNERNRSVSVLLITADILPEDPFNVLKR